MSSRNGKVRVRIAQLKTEQYRHQTTDNCPDHSCDKELLGDHFMILAENIFRNEGFDGDDDRHAHHDAHHARFPLQNVRVMLLRCSFRKIFTYWILTYFVAAATTGAGAGATPAVFVLSAFTGAFGSFSGNTCT